MATRKGPRLSKAEKAAAERRSAAALKGAETKRRKAAEAEALRVKRSEAARKGAETKRQRAAAAKRSEAARKGAETKRRKAAEEEALRAKRSAAALKGRETRWRNKFKPVAAPAAATKKAPKKPAPAPGTVLHAGVRYRRGKDRDRKGSDVLNAEVTVILRKPGAIAPEDLNAVLQEWAQTGELPEGVRKIDVVTWSHGGQRMEHAETRDEIEEVREDMLARIAPHSEFFDLG